MFDIVQQMAVTLLAHSELSGTERQGGTLSEDIMCSSEKVNNRGRQEKQHEYGAGYSPGFVAINNSRGITISVTISVSTQ